MTETIEDMWYEKYDQVRNSRNGKFMRKEEVKDGLKKSWVNSM